MVSGASLCQSQSNCPKSEDSRVTFHRAPLWLGPPLFKFNCCTATSMHLFVQLSRSHPIKFLSFPFNSNHLTPKNHKKKQICTQYSTLACYPLPRFVPVSCQLIKSKEKTESLASASGDAPSLVVALSVEVMWSVLFLSSPSWLAKKPLLTLI